MEGQGVVDLDHPKYYNGGRGILVNVMKNPKMLLVMHTFKITPRRCSCSLS